MSKIWFIRHGESVSNANLPTSDPALSELTARGHKEAAFVAQAFRQAPDLIVASPYLRAQQTAVPTQNRFPTVLVEEWPVYEFTYIHPEKYNGTTGSQRAPFAHAYWERNDPFEKEAGEGESFAELMERIKWTKDTLHTQSAEFIAVFSHGLFLRALLWSILSGHHEATSQSMQQFYNFIRGLWLPNCAIFEGVFKTNGRVSVTGFDTSHIPVDAFPNENL